MKKMQFFFLYLMFAVLIPFMGAWDSEAISQKTSPEGQEDLRALLPENGAIAGWKIAPGSKIFKPEDLWEHIDGQAEFYLDYGFRQLLTADYAPSGGTHFIAMEIYQMENPNDAFGIYAAERSPEEHFLQGRIQGYSGKDFLNFRKGSCYVKLASIQNDSDMGATLLELSGIIAKKIKGPDTEPALFASFPEKNRVKRSERFIPKNFLGQPYMKNGYRVDYAQGSLKYQLFLIRNVSREEAKQVFEKYQKFLASKDEILPPVEKPGHREIAVKGKDEYVFQCDSFVGGIVNSAGLKEADTIIEGFIQRLMGKSTSAHAVRPVISEPERGLSHSPSKLNS